ncbi:MAG: stage III sporulation protein AB [Lachnospiraceae bacterium]|nr:stage III sporulation protein AB [Lachnospiraceae bacterium]
MLKIIGIGLIMAGCIGSGWFLSGKALRRIHLLEEWESLLQLLYGEVDYAGHDLPDLIRRMIDQSHETVQFWKRIDRQLGRWDAGRISTLWKKELQHRDWQILQEQELRILEELGEIIGQTDRQTQLHSIHLYQQRLGMVLKQAKESYQGQARVYHVAGITVGSFLVILLL